MTYLAMNRFSVNVEREADWEAIWKNRETYLQDVPGFVQFMLLRGAEPGDYISYSQWESKEAFFAWTQSEAFRKGHAQGGIGDVLKGPPILGLFEPVITESVGSREVTDSLPDPNRRGPHH